MLHSVKKLTWVITSDLRSHDFISILINVNRLDKDISPLIHFRFLNCCIKSPELSLSLISAYSTGCFGWTWACSDLDDGRQSLKATHRPRRANFHQKGLGL